MRTATRSATSHGPQSPSIVRRALLNRATFGHHRAAREELDALGADRWLDRQLDPASVSDFDLDARLAGYPWMGRTPAELRAQYTGGGWALSEESKAVRLLRATYSERQLFERVVDLWNDHFNVPFSAQDANYLRPFHEEHVVRAHALGTFPEFLWAVMRSPATGAYLDQDSNKAGDPNDNFARELLELYTLGEGNGYTEVDVREVARCFTGWGYVRHWQSGEFGTFRFEPAQHDNDQKVVLGYTIPAGGGEGDGAIVHRILSRDPRTARTVAKKIVRAFLGAEAAEGQVAFESGESVLESIESIYLGTGGDIRAMIHGVLRQKTLRAVAPWRRRKLKAPFHFAVSLLRAVGARVTSPTTAVYALEGLGQVPFEWPDPDGYPDDVHSWAGTLAPRWKFASTLLNGWASWVDVDPSDLAALCFGTGPAQWGRCVSAAFTAGEMEPSDVAQIQGFIDSSVAPGSADLIAAFELGASSPSFQTY